MNDFSDFNFGLLLLVVVVVVVVYWVFLVDFQNAQDERQNGHLLSILRLV
jgi:hypothetical protein